jgi:L-lactate utilization protein LutC
MKTTNKMVKICTTPVKEPSTSKIKFIATGSLFALVGLLETGGVMAQNSDSLATKPIDSLPNTEVKTPQ